MQPQHRGRYLNRSYGDGCPNAGETGAVSLPAESLTDMMPDDPEPPKREFSSPFAFAGVVIVGALVVIGCVLGTTMSGLFKFGGDTSNAAADTVSSAPSGPRVPGTSFEDG